jgi:uncharacterized short protein YbdD (DUF466 family)
MKNEGRLRLEGGMNLRFEISNLRAVWWWLRQVFGDAAYENYLRSQQGQAQRIRGKNPAATHREPRKLGATHECRLGHSAGNARLLSREEFYLDMLRRRYSGVSRCC